jgi:iron complex transport system substrate-binding protein
MKKLVLLLAALPLMANAAAERIITLGGDVSEIAWALGAGPQMVARDSTSTWPARCKSFPTWAMCAS